MAFGGGSDGIAQTPMPARLPAPVITPPGDVFNAASWDRIVIISCDVPEATIRFTTDGTEPGEESAVYTEPILVPDEAHVKAKAYKTNSAPSPTAAAYHPGSFGGTAELLDPSGWVIRPSPSTVVMSPLAARVVIAPFSPALVMSPPFGATVVTLPSRPV